MKKIHTNNTLYRLRTNTYNGFGDCDFLCVDLIRTKAINDPSLGINITGKSNQSQKTTETSLYFFSKQDAEDFAKLKNISAQYHPVPYNNASYYDYGDVIEFKPGKYIYLTSAVINRIYFKYPALNIDIDSFLDTPATEIADKDADKIKALFDTVDKAYVSFVATLKKKLSAAGFKIKIEGDYLHFESTTVTCSFDYKSADNNLRANLVIQYELNDNHKQKSASINIYHPGFESKNSRIIINKLNGKSFNKAKAKNIVTSFYSLSDCFNLYNFRDIFSPIYSDELSLKINDNNSIKISGRLSTEKHLEKKFTPTANISNKIDKETDKLVNLSIEIKNKVNDELNILYTALSNDIDDKGNLICNDL